MNFPRRGACLLLLAWPAFAGAINTDAAIAVGKGTVVSRTVARYDALDADIDRYLARQTVAFGASENLTLFGSLGYIWNRPGPDGFTDLKLFGRYEFYGRDAKRETLSFAALLGVEVPLGNRPMGGGDGGLVAGLVGTWFRDIWQIDSDVEYTYRPDREDLWRADLALSVAFHEAEKLRLVGVLEANYRRQGSNDTLFLAPGLQIQFTRFLLELSIPIRVAEDSNSPTARFAAVLGIRFMF
ncbi:MAG: hypothetical protein ACYTGZ_01665 [Planctomycetota bacterium]|jgi:hypothetical protein